jgi:hypothetical protein
MLLGAWGAVVPFVGPYFDYSFGTNATWQYTSDRLWLNILPGAAALLGGLLILLAARRSAGVLGGWLALTAGAWFVIGPAVSLTWEQAAGPIGKPLFGSTRQMLELLGYFYGLGALVVALSAFAIGRFAPRARAVAAPAAEPAALAEPAATGSEPLGRQRAPGYAPAERRRRFGFPRLRHGRTAIRRNEGSQPETERRP